MLCWELNKFFVFIKLKDHRKILQKLLTERDKILYNNIMQTSKSHMETITDSFINHHSLTRS